MKPLHQSRFANVLMGVGLAPWLAVLAWVISILLLNKRSELPIVFMLDPIGMIGFMMTVYVFSLVIAEIGLWWSLSLTRIHRELSSKIAVTLRIAVGVLVGVPLLLTILGDVLQIL